MKRVVMIFFFTMYFFAGTAISQCSICTRTAQQMGEKPAKALNAGIIYLAFAPLAIGAFIGFKWWKNNRD